MGLASPMSLASATGTAVFSRHAERMTRRIPGSENFEKRRDITIDAIDSHLQQMVCGVDVGF
jgi:hypothetical protein